MKVLNYQDVLTEKFKRRKDISEIEYHVNGQCVHIGKISPGCRICFTNESGGGVQVGQGCNANCPMCYYDRKRNDSLEPKTKIDNRLADLFYNIRQDNFKPICMAYQSTGETAIYHHYIEQFALLYRQNCKDKNINTYHHYYTNGIFCDEEMLKRMKDVSIHEIRFHITASNYTKEGKRNVDKVLKHMEIAKNMGFVVSVEEPSWPLHKKQLTKLMKQFNDIGVSHFNIVEVQVTEHNKDNIIRVYPEASIWKDYYWHLYDNGLVYDLMEEKVKNGYTFSMLDCNSGVERFRHGKFQQTVHFDYSSISGMCSDFDYFQYAEWF